METFLIKTLQLILSLSILVFLHEFGHFFFARLFKVRVDKFYMFFNPKFSLIRAKKINGKWQVKFFASNVPENERQKMNAQGEAMLDAKGKPVMEPIPLDELHDDDWRKHPETTEWGIGWLPLGGYCKIAGMIDESMDKAQLALPPQKWEYRSRSVWQRLPIITGGVLVNFILAMLIYAAVLFTWGQEYLPFENARYGLQFSPTMIENGFRQGDKVLSVNGEAVEQRADFIEKVLIDGKRNVQVLRDDTLEVAIQLPADFAQRILAAEELNLVSVRFPFVIEEVQPGTPAEIAQLQPGDSVVAVNDKPCSVFQDVSAELEAHAGDAVSVSFYRNGALKTTKLNLTENAKMGVALRPIFNYFETEKIEYGFFEAIPAGISLGWETLVSYVKQFKLVFTKEGSKQLGGFGSIGKMFPNIWDWQIFWSMTALLSVILAFMNFLPIPALDGGHVMFLLYEMITGRKPGEKFMEYAQTAGMLLLLSLLIFANGNDIFKAFFK
ncbi:MAG: RIP metalloprotease RseP [Paludibacter sp.]|nr:RIP metalloprotease RseP [Paludibacter sp.]MDD4198306.1 RIP metalloprotease RseP [Paludibacter sp.]MDD4426930.1 RIP metalloprotease RseP [Paludibacter sp.]